MQEMQGGEGKKSREGAGFWCGEEADLLLEDRGLGLVSLVECGSPILDAGRDGEIPDVLDPHGLVLGLLLRGRGKKRDGLR